VKRLYPESLLAIGPAIDRGFYYDFDVKTSFTKNDLNLIEKEMKRIIKRNFSIERFELKRSDAIKLMQKLNEIYKIEIINGLKDNEIISFYRQGEFVDLCLGPHLNNTGMIKSFKLLSTTGAYWCGDAKNKMLCRIYGISFPNDSLLEDYLINLEESKNRDHNKLGRELEIFTISSHVGKGLPIFLPYGAKMLRLLQNFVENEEEKRGYLLTITPFMAKSDLYKISGHWDHYKENMFVIGNDENGKEVLALRPMTCPFQFQIFLNKTRSYRDLPMRLSETSTMFRNEASGEMHGLIRIRQFTLSDGHIICAEEHLEDEFKSCLELAIFCLKKVGLYDDVSYRFSKCDLVNNKEKYIGTENQWKFVQEKMQNILDDLGLIYESVDGEAAFYGPKLDLQIKNVYGKEDTLITLQIDFQLAERFSMKYTDQNGLKKYPYIIHRTSIGCYERTLALMIEKFAGAFPVWIAPVQVLIIPVSIDKNLCYAKTVMEVLKENGIRRVEINDRNEKLGYRLRSAQLKKIPYMLIVGESEEREKSVSMRTQKNGDVGILKLYEFLKIIKKDIESFPSWNTI
jgi:threonyl-tRNA synthetase